MILDAKRGDIGSTAEQYAREAFERYRADAVTLSPYMGFDSIEPYLAYAGRGAILLCRTSNAGGSDLQSLGVSADATLGAPAERLFERVARLAAGPWNRSGELGLVVGATFPDELRARALACRRPARCWCRASARRAATSKPRWRPAPTADGLGMIVNSSRAILYASGGEDFAQAAALVAIATRDALRAAQKRRGG